MRARGWRARAPSVGRSGGRGSRDEVRERTARRTPRCRSTREPVPSVAWRSARMPQVGAKSHDTGCSQPGQNGDRDQQAGDHPDRPLEQVAEHERRPVAHERRREQEAEAPDRADRRGHGDGERHPVVITIATPKSTLHVDEPDRERVDADRGDRDRDRQDDRPERRRRRRRATRGSPCAAASAARRRPAPSSSTRCPSRRTRAPRRAATAPCPFWNRKYASVAKISGDATHDEHVERRAAEHLEVQPEAEQHHARQGTS